MKRKLFYVGRIIYKFSYKMGVLNVQRCKTYKNIQLLYNGQKY